MFHLFNLRKLVDIDEIIPYNDKLCDIMIGI